MSAVKERITEVVENQPEDSSYDEVLKELALDKMIAYGLRDSREGRMISNQDMKNRIAGWQK